MACESGECSCVDCSPEEAKQQLAERNLREYGPVFDDALRRLADAMTAGLELVDDDSPEARRFEGTVTRIFAEYENRKGDPDFWSNPAAMKTFGDRITLAADSIRAEAFSTSLDEAWYSDWKALLEGLYARGAELTDKFGNVVTVALPTATWLVWGLAALVALYYLGPAAGRYASKRA